jgi:AraC family transcriptional regulator
VTKDLSHTFHGLELPVRALSGARALRIVHPAGQLIPPHRHDWPLLTLPALGGYQEETDDGCVGVAGPAVVLHPPGRCHANCIHPLGMETFSIEFDPAWLGLSRSDRLFDSSLYWIGGAVPLASRALAKLWNDAQASENMLQSATAEFLQMAIGSRANFRPAWLGAVRTAIEVNETATATATRIASTLEMHPRWLAHAYRQAAGEGLHDTILRRRVERAAHLLRSSERAIADVAFAAGFCDQSHLNRALRKFTGRTPVQLRAERASLQALLD